MTQISIEYTDREVRETARAVNGDISVQGKVTSMAKGLERIEGSCSHSDRRRVGFSYYRNGADFNMNQEGSASLMSEAAEFLGTFIASVKERCEPVDGGQGNEE